MCLVLTLACLSLAPAAAQRGPGRIAVGGMFPTGYVGCLARFGLPRDLLFDAQLADVETLKNYDLVLLAGAPADSAISEAVQKYLDGGGTVIIDYSSASVTIPNVQLGERLRQRAGSGSGTPGGFGAKGMSRSPVQAAGKDSPLAGVADERGVIGASYVGFVPDDKDLTEVQVLAEYPTTVRQRAAESPTVNGRGVLERLRMSRVDMNAGPGAPAILLGRKGKGRVLLCGLQVGLGTSLMGLDFDSLTLAMIKLATNGRAVSQLVPEGPHLGRKASLRSMGRSAEGEVAHEEAPAPVDEGRPNGPGATSKIPQGFTQLEAEPAEEFNVTASVPATSGDVLLHYWNIENYIRVKITPTGVGAWRLASGQAEPQLLGYVKANLPVGQKVVIKERCDTLMVRSGASFLSRSVAGIHRGGICSRGLGSEVDYQQMEAVYFADDFMRTNEQTSPWETVGGTWTTTPVQNPDMGANPFSYKCEAPTAIATALSGQPFWDEYQYQVAIRPGGTQGALGIGWYAKDADNMYLFQAQIRTAAAPVAGGFQLLRLVGGVPTVLAEMPGGVQAGEWYKFKIRAEGPRLEAWLDGVRILTANDSTYAGGKVALRVDHGSGRFDDVVTEAVVLSQQRGAKIEGKVPDHAGLIDVDSWAGPATSWDPDPEVGGLFWRRNSFFGDMNLDFEWPKVPDGGQVSLVVDGDGKSMDTGYVVRLTRAGTKARIELRHLGSAMKTAEVAVDEKVKLRIRRKTEVTNSGAPIVHIDGLLGDATVLSATVPSRGEGGRLAFRTVGFQPKISALTVWSLNLKDYTFDTAPCDWWVASGIWDLTNRWSCTPDWSWYGGFSDQQAVVWNKQEFAGDVVVDYYAGAKMLNEKVPGYFGAAKERTGDFNVTLCGDGRSTDSGYSCRIGPDPASALGRAATGGVGAVLLRNGKEVAKNEKFRFFSRGHNRWANIRAEKHGPRVTVYVDGQVVLQYTDPEPLERGFVAVWTQNNGIMIPRITIAFEGLGKEFLSLK